LEVDGYSHYDQEAQENDRLRDSILQEHGLFILRIDDKDVKRDMLNVLRRIEGYIDDFEEAGLHAGV
jgi:very-short-patch-repair endonuclease